MKWFMALFAALFLGMSYSRIASAEDTSGKSAKLISKENSVDSSRPPAEWRPAAVGQELIVHDRLRTGEDSRAAVQFGDASILRIDELTEEEIILPSPVAGSKPTMDLKQGSAYFFSREKSREIHVQTPAANGAIRGTEFVVAVAADGSTSFTILDGEVEVSNSQGSVLVQSGERADIESDGKPAKTPVTDAIDSAQWCFHYPGVLDLNDLALSPSEQDALRESLSAYGQGDVLRALADYPHGRATASSGEKVYRAGLFLVAGQVRKAQDLLHELDEGAPGRQALSTLIAAVTLKEKSASAPPRTATDWIAESYYRQSKSDLAGALQAAERAANLDPNFGFAWTQIAASQFNLGRVPEANEALEKGLKFAPHNPAAHALRGFLFSAENKLKDAKDSFETAIALDSALGDGWFGHGLCLIKQGHVKAGRRDLLIAAALEPNRLMFRKYLSENFSALGGGTTGGGTTGGGPTGGGSTGGGPTGGGPIGGGPIGGGPIGGGPIGGGPIGGGPIGGGPIGGGPTGGGTTGGKTTGGKTTGGKTTGGKTTGGKTTGGKTTGGKTTGGKTPTPRQRYPQHVSRNQTIVSPGPRHGQRTPPPKTNPSPQRRRPRPTPHPTHP